jgi:uncharacterized protein (TIGR02453 family)
MEFNHLYAFLTKLKINNNKPWFDAHKAEYQELRRDWIEFVGALLNHLQKKHPVLIDLEPKKCIFRINKDIRFSKDKLPYKTNFGMQINFLNRKDLFCGYYLHIEPQNTFVAGGIYMPPSNALAAIRQEIDYNAAAITAILSQKKLIANFGQLQGEKLVKAPKGFDINHPMIEILKHKSFVLQKNFSESVTKNPMAFQEELITSFSLMDPLISFLLTAVEEVK